MLTSRPILRMTAPLSAHHASASLALPLSLYGCLTTTRKGFVERAMGWPDSACNFDFAARKEALFELKCEWGWMRRCRRGLTWRESDQTGIDSKYRSFPFSPVRPSQSRTFAFLFPPSFFFDLNSGNLGWTALAVGYRARRDVVFLASTRIWLARGSSYSRRG